MYVECIDTENGFVALRDEWESLRSRSHQRSVFMSHDWFSCCWRELKDGNQLRIFVVRDENVPLLIAPLMIRRVAETRIPVRALTFMEHPETQVCDLLVAPGDVKLKTLDVLFSHLAKVKGDDWQLLMLDKISSYSELCSFLQNYVAANVVVSSRIDLSHEALVLPLSGTWDDYLAGQSVRFRKTLRNIVNRVHRLGRIQINTYQGRESIGLAIEKIFAVSNASWKQESGVAITSSSKRMRFFEDLAIQNNTSQEFRIVTADLDGQAIASEIQIVDGNVVYAVRSDFDDRFADSSPGTFLQMEILKQLFGGECIEYHFGVGLNRYKFRWADERRQYMRFKLYRKGVFGRIMQLADRCEPMLEGMPIFQRLNAFITGKTV